MLLGFYLMDFNSGYSRFQSGAVTTEVKETDFQVFPLPHGAKRMCF
jgi:hypothetical protein